MVRLFGKIPLSVTPAFWMIAGLLGYLNTNSLTGTVIWVAVIFVSVLVHELGHASATCFFGLKPSIELVAFGGVTRHFAGSLSLGKQFLIVLTGPLFGLLLFIFALMINQYVTFQSGALLQFFWLLQAINLFWTIVNVFPVLPLDGGQMLRLVFEALFGRKGLRYALCCSMVISLLGALVFFSLRMFLVGAFFSLFAYQSYMDFKKVKEYLEEDLTGDLQKMFSEAENNMQIGKVAEAADGFYQVLKQVPSGKARVFSCQYLALLEYQKGNRQVAYDLLISVKKQLSEEGLCLLHRLAFEVQNYDLVIELSGLAFQKAPSQEVALYAAKSQAQKSHASECVGWLESALELGLQNPSQVISDPLFDPIQDSSIFTKWKCKKGF